MDQFTINHGKKNNLIFLNCLDKKHEFVRFDLDKHSLLLINSNVKHSLLHSQYNDRVAECNNVLVYLVTNDGFYTKGGNYYDA